MSSKAPLVLMEQLVMVLVFALAAALCVQAFALADRISQQNEARDQAVLAAQSTAELLKHCRGDYAEAASRLGGSWDGETLELSREAACHVRVLPTESGIPLLGTAEVLVCSAEGEVLFSLPAAWQEVVPHA